MTDLFSTSTAAISQCGAYRYELTRRWEERGSIALWIMLNPSTADADRDDPTIRRCIGFSKREGMAGLVVVNLFALRATDPDKLGSFFDDTVGPENETYLRKWFIAPEVKLAIAAWGAHPVVRRRPEVASFVTEWAADESRALQCLGRTASGHPRHPLYVRGDQPLETF